MELNAVEAVLVSMLELMEAGVLKRNPAVRSLVLQRFHRERTFSSAEGRVAWNDAVASGLIIDLGEGYQPELSGEGEAAAISIRNSLPPLR